MIKQTLVFQGRVHGTPKPGGSKKYVGHSKAGRPIIVDASGKPGTLWRHNVANSIRGQYPHEPLGGPLFVEAIFLVARPKGHYKTKFGAITSELKDSAPPFPTPRPDTTKLWRLAEDALTGILWYDDAQVIGQGPWKFYARIPADAGMKIRVYTLEGTSDE